MKSFASGAFILRASHDITGMSVDDLFASRLQGARVSTSAQFGEFANTAGSEVAL